MFHYKNAENMQPVYYDRPYFSQNQTFSGEYSQSPPVYAQLQPIQQQYSEHFLYPNNTQGRYNTM